MESECDGAHYNLGYPIQLEDSSFAANSYVDLFILQVNEDGWVSTGQEHTVVHGTKNRLTQGVLHHNRTLAQHLRH